MTTKKEETPKPAIKYDRQAVFVGRRIGLEGKTVWRFELLPERTPMAFSRIKGVWIGHTYECTDKTIAGKPKRVDREREDNPEWEALDRHVDAVNAEKRVNAKLAADSRPAMKAAITALVPLVRAMDSFSAEMLVRHLVAEARQIARKKK